MLRQSIRPACKLALCLGLLLAAPLLDAVPASAGTPACTGDCDADETVSISELITMVKVALGRDVVGACASGDTNDDGIIQINELVRAVRDALEGCGGAIQPLPFKNRIKHPSDPFLAFSAIEGGPTWGKFTIRVNDPEVVYFQNSRETPFHRDFVTATLEPYVGWTRVEIDEASLHAEGQELVFGAVLYSPTRPFEIAIQLVRNDAYSVDEVSRYFEAVRASVDAEPDLPFFYFPSLEQQLSAEENRAALLGAGIPLGSAARWLPGDICYAFGWAHGQVVFVASDEIESAYEEGTLGPQDILLTDGVPSEIPFVAGVLSLAPSTPSSHVAILAGDWGIPFAFLSQAETVAAAQQAIGREVIVRATTLTPRFFIGQDVDPEKCQVRLVDVTDSLDAEVVAEIDELKQVPDLDIRPIEAAGGYDAEVDTATPDDIVTIGGKAANFGFLLREIPRNTRPAIAFTFDLWSDYLDQQIDGVTLRARIENSLAPFPTYPPPDFRELYDALAGIRDLIDDEADFTPTQRTAITAALQRFDPTRRIRFRSSTNVEDSDVFTGAGLYESKSGCLLDDMDDDDVGPSICEPDEEDERGVFRALRKVFASFYNDNAFLERLRHRVDENRVGMAVLVHHNFPDPTELANGVATLQTHGSNAVATIVTQPGAFSVTNPEDDGIPEVVEVLVFPNGLFPALRQGSERLPLGATVLRMPDEYLELTNLLIDVGTAFGEFHDETTFDLEFEFKKIFGEGLVVKQVRRIPRAGAEPEAPLLIHRPGGLCTFQGEYGDIFANYRLKTRWEPVFRNGPVHDEKNGVFASADHRYVLDGEVVRLEGAPSTWIAASRETFDPPVRGDVLGIIETWSVGSGNSQRTMKLRTMIPTSIGPAFIPILFPDDLGFTLEAEFATPVPFQAFVDGGIQTRTVEDVRLIACADERPLTDLHTLQEREFEEGPVNVATSFYWPPPPTASVVNYTAPVDRWLGTAIDGIAATRTNLGGYFSQTYRPAHGSPEGFVFDPHLDDGVPTEVIADWDSLGIQALIKPFRIGNPPMLALTADGMVVEVADLLADR